LPLSAQLKAALEDRDHLEREIDSLLSLIERMRNEATLKFTCVDSSSFVVVKVAKLFPGQVLAVPHKHFLAPLCCAFKRNDLSLDVYEHLIEQYPKNGIRGYTEVGTGSTTLIKTNIIHEACEPGASAQVFKLILGRFPPEIIHFQELLPAQSSAHCLYTQESISCDCGSRGIDWCVSREAHGSNQW
jgi:hypothetical protein